MFFVNYVICSEIKKNYIEVIVDEGKTSAEAVRETLELAQLADELGFHRFWVSEHHNVPALSICAPEVVIAYLASHTKNIHIGSGGIMGLHY